MSWIYKTHQIEDITQFPENTFGFVYMTTHKPTGKSYIGKKVLFHNQKKKLGKKELAALTGIVGRRPSYKLVVKESDWKTYYGSQTDIKQLLTEGKKDEFERTILKMCPDKKSMTYFEVKYQMLYQVLEKPDEFFNDNILGKFYTKDLKNIEFEDSVSTSI
jgi:ubiquinone biosynthesis protein Coq4